MSGISLMCMNRNRQESSYEVLNPYSPCIQVEQAEVEGSEGSQVSATVLQPSAISSTPPSQGSSAQPSAERGRESRFVKE